MMNAILIAYNQFLVFIGAEQSPFFFGGKRNDLLLTFVAMFDDTLYFSSKPPAVARLEATGRAFAR